MSYKKKTYVRFFKITCNSCFLKLCCCQSDTSEPNCALHPVIAMKENDWITPFFSFPKRWELLSQNSEWINEISRVWMAAVVSGLFSSLLQYHRGRKMSGLNGLLKLAISKELFHILCNVFVGGLYTYLLGVSNIIGPHYYGLVLALKYNTGNYWNCFFVFCFNFFWWQNFNSLFLFL